VSDLDLDESIEVMLSKSSKWAMTYGDLMSSLMILFLILFSFSVLGGIDGKLKIDQLQQSFGAKANSQLANTVKQITMEEDVATEIKGFIDNNQLSAYAVIKVDDYKIKIMLTQSVTFKSGKSYLMESGKPILEKLVQMLKTIENTIVIEGHTDDIPIIGGSNYELSTQRAYSVLKFLEAEGIDASRISIAGYGEQRPLVPNISDENRGKNRRVEINIIRNHTDLMEVY